MWWQLSLCVIFSFSLFSNPVGLETIKGTASLQGEKGSLHIHASNGAVLHWKDFSIGTGECTQFFQPGETSWVLNHVTGKHSSEILGTLLANGQVVLLNPHGILFGNGSVVDVGGIIASTLNESSIVCKGVIHARSGDVILLGKAIENSGVIEITGKSLVKGEDNPYALAINYVRPKEATALKEVNGRILLISEERTVVPQEGKLIGKEIALLSSGKTVFEGSVSVDNGMIEISGKNGFKHSGVIHRSGGHLILDPEADVTISQTVPYNYSFDLGAPTADISNISIDLLLREIENGPVTITTAYQCDGGKEGSIHIQKDVTHTYHSSYPLIFNCSGCGGINVEGKLRNLGSGEIAFNSNKVSISGEIAASKIETNGYLTCTGGLYGQTIKVSSEKGGLIGGKVIADGGPLTWIGGGTLSLMGGELGNAGNDALTIQGLENVTLEAGARLFTLFSNLSISDLSGALSVEDSTILSNGPLTISGKEGALHLSDATIQSNSSLNINLERYLHCHDSHLNAQQNLSLSLGSDLIITGSSLLTSTNGISLNNKGALLMDGYSMIKGQGLSLIVGESTRLNEASKIDGEKGSLSLTSGGTLTIEGREAAILAGQVSIHIGEEISVDDYGKITSFQGPTYITAGKGISLFKNGSISAARGNLDLFVTQGNLNLYGNSSLNSTTHGSHIIIGKSLQMENFSSISSVGEKGTTIVVDHLGVGGGIAMGLNSSIITGSSPLQIFTASQDHNSIRGTLNGHHYIGEIPLYLVTNQDHWGISYPNNFFAKPFIVFHKENGLIQTTIGPVNHKTFIRHIVGYIGPFTAELFRDLHPYDQYTKESITFTDNEEPYFIRRRSEK
ncbi:MAG: filamentous hemagglutinin N-terminal domain-containing protein [Simkaniaceae bacterium]|nr:MAG: filamentous hemagglutinin N-terminal domain-containing protein [Simkaniaceae bacterium]